MSNQDPKNFIILPDGESPFPNSGKPRVRVYQDDGPRTATEAELARLTRKLELQREMLDLDDDKDKALSKILAKQREIAKLDQEIAESSGDIKDALETQRQELQDQIPELQRIAEVDDERLQKSQEMYKQQLALREEVERERKLKQDIADISKAIFGIQLDQLNSAKSLTLAALEFAQALDGANVELAQTTGYTSALQGDMQTLAVGAATLGIGAADSAKIIGGLATTMTTFAIETAATREQIADTAAALTKMGVGAEETGQALELLTRGMGLSARAANQALQDFDMLGQKLGLPTSQLIKDFNTLGPQLARFGTQAKAEFEKLSMEARKLGISVQQAFDLTEKLDTFEGAADFAGKLNAQIGLQLNSVRLMTASHAERLNMMREEFFLRGKNFEEMGRRQKQAVAEMLGVDVDLASKLFGDPVQLRKYQKEQKGIQERAEKMTAAMDKFKVALEEMFMVFAPIVTGFMEFVKTPGVKFLAQALLLIHAVKGLTMAFGPLMFTLKIIPQRVRDAVASFFTLGASSDATTPQVGTLGKVSQLTAKQIMALAAGALAVGIAIGVAAFGVAQIVEAFKGMGAEAIAAVAGILAFGAALYFAAPAIAAAGAAGYVAAVPILAIGAAFMMAGVGVGFMAQGLAMLVEGFVELAPHFLPMALAAYPLALGLFLVSKAMMGLAIAMIPLVNPITLFAFNALSTRLERLGTTLQILSTSAASAGSVISSSFKEIASSIKLLGQQIPIMYQAAIALGALGVALNVIGISFLNPMLIAGLSLFTVYLAGIAASLALIAVSTDALGSLEKIITVATSVDTTELDNMRNVMGEVRATFVASKAADRQVFERAADAVQNVRTPRLNTKIPIQLVVNKQVLGNTVVDLFEERADVTGIS